MNEKEMKEIWQTAGGLPNINLQAIEKEIADRHAKLMRKLRIDIWLGVISLVLASSLYFFLKEIAYYLPLLALISLWYFWDIRRIRKFEAESVNYERTTDFLATAAAKLQEFMNRYRIIMYTLLPLIAFSTLFFNLTPEQMLVRWPRVVIILVLSEILAIAVCETYFRIMYIPSLKQSRELLRQLTSGGPDIAESDQP